MALLPSLASIYLMYAGALFLVQRDMLYPGQNLTVAAEARLPDARSEQFFVEVDDARVEAWLLRPESNVDAEFPVLVVAHGNNELIDDMPGLFAIPRSRGWGVLLVEYPGYGRSEGRPSQEAIVTAFDLALQQVAARPDVDAGRLVGFGRSLGGGVICALSARHRLDALILQSTFTSVRAFSTRYLLPGFLARDPYDNLAALEAFAGPVRIYHGRQDGLIEYAHAEQLAETAGVQEVALACGHNDCPISTAAYWQDLLGFLEQNLDAAPGRSSR